MECKHSVIQGYKNRHFLYLSMLRIRFIPSVGRTRTESRRLYRSVCVNLLFGVIPDPLIHSAAIGEWPGLVQLRLRVLIMPTLLQNSLIIAHSNSRTCGYTKHKSINNQNCDLLALFDLGQNRWCHSSCRPRRKLASKSTWLL